MTISIILFIGLALLVALGFAFFQYLFKKRKTYFKDYIFFVLRFLSVFIVLLLLINPKIVSTSYSIQKPDLIIAADNSLSINYLEKGDTLKQILANLKNNRQLNESFNITTLNFGRTIQNSDSLNFKENQTDINATLEQIEDAFSANPSAVILLSDGNQSMGRDYTYYKSGGNQEIIPLIVGDTSKYKDLSIQRLTVNSYAFLNNKFPFEIFLNFSGNENVTSTFKIRKGNTILFQKKLNFSKEEQTKIIRGEILASGLGVNSFVAEIEALSEERNIQNNIQNFGIEVIDERSSILLLSDISHPDLGAVKKAVESNKQRALEIKYIQNNNFQVNDYQLIILYQPNEKFNNIIAEIKKNKLNFFIISGTQTSWNFLNQTQLGFSKNYTNQTQELFAVYNPGFGGFQFEDIGFDDFPPLEDKFGTISIQKNNFETLLHQRIQNVATTEPLLAISGTTPKFGLLFGENIWRWRAKSFLDHQSFDVFDNFFNKIIQNLASKKFKERLRLEYENFYYSNEKIVINAEYFDENYQFDPRADLSITVSNSGTKESFTSDLLLKGNVYQFEAENLEPATYNFVVNGKGANVSKTGSFKIIAYNTEQQFVSANLEGMQQLAQNNGSSLYFANTIPALIQKLSNSNNYKSIQKSHQKRVPLIDWYYLLFLLIMFLAVEWFYRKYLGLI